MERSISNEPILSADNPALHQTLRDTRRPYEKQLAVHLVLATNLFASAALFSFDVNVGSYLSSNKTLNWTVQHGANAELIFDGIHLVAILIFAILSDAKLNRTRTIIIGFPLYLTGFILFTLISTGKVFICYDNESNVGNITSIGDEKCAPLILASIILTAIGDGAVTSSLIAFGADQISESIVTSRYCDKLVVVMQMAFIVQDSAQIIIIRNQDYFTFYMVAASMLFLAILLFIIGWRYYIYVDAYDSVVYNCIPIYKNAFQTWYQCKKDQRSARRRLHVANASFSLDNERSEESTRVDDQPARFLDYAKVVNNGKFNDQLVDDVKLLQSAIIIFILIVPYWFVYAQVYTAFPMQAKYMVLQGSHDTVDFNNLMLISEHLTTIVGIFIINMFIYKYLHARNQSLRITTKFIISMCFSFITMCVAGGIEILRQDYCPTNDIQFNSTMNSSNLSIYAQTPQYIILGLSQAFGLLASIQFAYFIAPRSAKSLFMSLHYISRITAEYIADEFMTYLLTTSSEVNFSCQNNERWHTYAYFYISAGIQILFAIAFIICQKYYRLIKLKS